jgi:hypothetical protein
MKLKPSLSGVFLFAVLLLLFSGCTTTGEQDAADAESLPEAVAEPETEIVTIPVLQRESSYIGEDILDSTRVYHWEGGRLAKVEVRDSFDDLIETVAYEYEGSDRAAQKSVLGPDGKLRSMRKYEYDSRGNLALEEVYNSREELQTSSEYLYDEGHLVRWNVTDGSGSLLAYTEYRWDGDRNVRIDTYSSGGVLTDYFIRTFVAGNLVSQERFTENGTSSGKVEYSYGNGLLTKEQHYRANGSLERTVSYEYDQEGSVVREVYRRADETVEQVISREFAYREEERVIEE